MCQVFTTEIVEVYLKKWVVKYPASPFLTISQAAQAQHQLACAARPSQLSSNISDMSVVGVDNDSQEAGVPVTPDDGEHEGGRG